MDRLTKRNATLITNNVIMLTDPHSNNLRCMKGFRKIFGYHYACHLISDDTCMVYVNDLYDSYFIMVELVLGHNVFFIVNCHHDNEK